MYGICEYIIWLVVSSIFFHFIYGLSSFPLVNIFQRGRYTNNQRYVSVSEVSIFGWIIMNPLLLSETCHGQIIQLVSQVKSHALSGWIPQCLVGEVPNFAAGQIRMFQSRTRQACVDEIITYHVMSYHIISYHLIMNQIKCKFACPTCFLNIRWFHQIKAIAIKFTIKITIKITIKSPYSVGAWHHEITIFPQHPMKSPCENPMKITMKITTKPPRFPRCSPPFPRIVDRTRRATAARTASGGVSAGSARRGRDGEVGSPN
jgi:hypothetical protein